MKTRSANCRRPLTSLAAIILLAAPLAAYAVAPAPKLESRAAVVARSAMADAHQATTDSANGITCHYADPALGPSFDWCVRMKPGAYDPTKVLYLLHGTQAQVRTILDSKWYADVVAEWQLVYGVKEPVTIAVSFGASWLTTDLPSSYVAGAPNLYHFFTDRLMPYVEAQALGPQAGSIATREILSQSMGSYNGGGLITRRPDLFSKAALTCPAWFPISKFSSAAEVAAYLARNRLANANAVSFGLHLLGQDEGDDPVPGIARWSANDPLQLVNSLGTRGAAIKPAFLIAYNLADTYGFQEGAQLFAARARAAGFQADEISNAGEHCNITPDMSDAIAKFFAQP